MPQLGDQARLRIGRVDAGRRPPGRRRDLPRGRRSVAASARLSVRFDVHFEAENRPKIDLKIDLKNAPAWRRRETQADSQSRAARLLFSRRSFSCARPQFAGFVLKQVAPYFEKWAPTLRL